MSEFAGTLNARVELWRPSGDRAESGASTDEWVLVDRCLARIDAEGAGPVTEAMSLSALPKFRVTIRAGLVLALDHQVRWRGRRLAIRQILEDPRAPDRLTLRCEELR